MSFRRRSSARRGGGFTLLELLVVLAVVSALVAVVPPLIANALPGVELEKTARELTTALATARSRAVARNEPTALRLDLDARQYRITGVPGTFELPDDVELLLYGAESEIPTETTGGIRFFPDGSSTGGRITVARDGRSYEIDVDWLFARIVLSD